MPRVVVLDNLSQEGLNALQSSGVVEYQIETGLKGDALTRVLREYDGAICRSGVKITADTLRDNHRLKVIVRAGTGTDNIDTEAATRLGIVVMNTPGGNTVSTAEHTITLMLALSRNIFPAYRSLIDGRWDRKRYMGTQVEGKTLGIIGLGRVGQSVAARALALGMRVLGYDPFLPPQRSRHLGITHCATMGDVLSEADYVTVHTVLSDETRHMIGSSEIQQMKPGARLINCARGGIIDTQALIDGLESGHLGGAALDVFESEPCTQSPLFAMPNVLCTPHLAASTEQAQTNVAVAAAEALIEFFTTGAIKSAVNMSPLDAVTLQDVRGYLNLAYRLGLFLAQMCDRPPTRCQLSYEGEVAQKDCRPISAAFAAGLLERAVDLEVNIVNAEFLLRQRGVELVQQLSSQTCDFRSLITAELESDGGSVSGSGTLLGDSIPGLVQLSHLKLEFRLEGTLLITTHTDKPGVIGKIGQVCGRHRVNVASLSIGRGSGDRAGPQVGAWTLDSEPPAEAMEELLALEPIEHANIVRLPPADTVPTWIGG